MILPKTDEEIRQENLKIFLRPRKTLAQAIEEAKIYTPRQRELAAKYPGRYAPGNTGGIGCIWK